VESFFLKRINSSNLLDPGISPFELTNFLGSGKGWGTFKERRV